MNDEARTRGVVAAALAGLDEAVQPLRDALTAADPAQGLASCFMRPHHQQALQDLRAQGYKTNDILEIGDNILDVLKASRVSINGTSLDLEVRELLLLFALVRQAQSQTRDRSRFWGAEARFASVATLLEEIERAKAEAKLEGLWQYAVDTDVHKAISRLRTKLADAGLNRNPIEGKRQRLSAQHAALEPGRADSKRCQKMALSASTYRVKTAAKTLALFAGL